jgi:hypothetical protein
VWRQELADPKKKESEDFLKATQELREAVEKKKAEKAEVKKD